MPIYKREDLWAAPAGEFTWIVTTNGVICRGMLVMGGGAALQAANKFEGLRTSAANIIRTTGEYNAVLKTWEYGYVSVLPASETGGVALFQTKLHYSGDSSIELIKKSTAMLDAVARQNSANLYRMNFPGIGLGRLDKSQVQPIIDVLPENVTVCFL